MFADDEVRPEKDEARDKVTKVVSLLLKERLERHELTFCTVVFEREGEEHDARGSEKAWHGFVHDAFGKDDAVDIFTVLRSTARHLLDPYERSYIH